MNNLYVQRSEARVTRSLFVFFLIVFCVLSLAPRAHASVLIAPNNNLGLVGYWPFNEGQGTVTLDKSGTGNTGTVGNGPTWVDGKFGTALSFDGSNDYVSWGTTSQPTNTFSFGAWVKTSGTIVVPLEETVGTSGLTNQKYLFWPNWGNANAGAGLSYGSNGMAVYEHGNGFIYANAVSSVSPGTGWNHVMVVYNNKTPSIYLNGVLVRTGLTSTKSVVYPPVSVADQSGGGGYGPFAGQIDDVRLYNRALSSFEIANLYQHGLAKRASLNKKGLLAYYPMNEGSGTVIYDKSGQNTANGTLTNGPVWAAGKFGAGIYFDGSDDYISIPNNSAMNPTATITVATWFYNSSSPSDRYEYVNHRNGYTLETCGTATSLCFYVYAGGGWQISPVATISNGQWYHAVATYDGSTLRLYLNGAEVGTGNAVSGTISYSSVPTCLGATSGATCGGRNLNGYMDDVRIYDRALSATEVAALYADSSASRITKISTSMKGGLLTNGLIGHWTFDGSDVSGTTAYDASGQGNNGTLANGVLAMRSRLGQALNFDGVDDYVQIANSGAGTVLDATSSLSVSSWVKFTGANVYNTRIVEKFWNSSYKLGGNNSGDGYDFIVNGVTAKESGGSASNQWTHLVGTYDGLNINLYKNGVLAATATTTPPGGTGNPLTIGKASNGGSDYFTGLIDDVRIYNRALSAAEVLKLYNMGK